MVSSSGMKIAQNSENPAQNKHTDTGRGNKVFFHIKGNEMT